MRNRIALPIFVASCFALLASPLLAAGDGVAAIGLHAGYMNTKDADDGVFLGGGQFRLRLLPSLAVEAAVDYREDEYRNGMVTVKTYPVLLSGLYYFAPGSTISLYMLGGVGWYFTDTEAPLLASSVDDETEFGYHAGAGVEFGGANSLTVYVDIRYFEVDFKPLDLELEHGGWLANAGFSFWF